MVCLHRDEWEWYARYVQNSDQAMCTFQSTISMCGHNCGKTFVKSHIDGHLADWPFRCRLCHWGFKTRELLFGHLMQAHASRQGGCIHCAQQFSNRNDIHAHLCGLHAAPNG
ncbi:uncharacterized protein C8Q71DRAFT_731644 [Rhodofomes roseus]|uniref:C2H2-type domain-containing protein n=1 Tax=Rhodofomes roseus TaxID=34475 RepID=A0ABQ8KY61_9APHY|nr:uncharacterized protein C8Q71DRAFT_731644 [Rhodofomes roseus]KAH9844181.1 hypothetical protein C8Q71DRAFT_731644 [Rhodofomes roseus]